MNQKHELSFRLLSTLLDITEKMVTTRNANEINALHNDGLQLFLQLKSLGRSHFERELTLPQPNPVYKQLSQYTAEKQFYLGQLNKARRENKEIDSYLFSVAGSSDFDIRNIDTELTTRIRLEKELLELTKKLKARSVTKDTEERKLDELKLKLKTFSDFSKPLNDYLSLGYITKTSEQNNQGEPERAALLSHQLPTPLYVLYKSLLQNILAYNKQKKLCVDIIEKQPDNYFNSLNISPLSVIFRIITHRKKDCERVVISLKFDYLQALDLVLVTTYSQRGENVQFDERFQGQKETQFLKNLMKNDNGDRLPSSSKAFLLPTLVPFVNELDGNAYNWVQALCGYSMTPCASLSFEERVNYRPLGQIADYVPDKFLPKLVQQETLKQDMRIDVDDTPVEIVEMDVLPEQGDLIMMQDSDYRREEKEEEEEAKDQVSETEDSEPKNDTNQEEENDMIIDDSKLNELIPQLKTRSGLTGDSSIVLNLVRMIKDHWWRNNF